jgi:hypothetical protein
MLAQLFDKGAENGVSDSGYVRTYVCTCVYVCNVCICMYVCVHMCVCMYVCMYVGVQAFCYFYLICFYGAQSWEVLACTHSSKNFK